MCDWQFTCLRLFLSGGVSRNSLHRRKQCSDRVQELLKLSNGMDQPCNLGERLCGTRFLISVYPALLLIILY